MFSAIFGGRLGEFLAPRPNRRQEIWTYLKSGLFDKASKALSKPNHGFDVNERDEATGMVPLHYASAAGKLELIAELLAQGADIRITDKNGNSALHYASKNDRKAAIEILLRSGADPTVPNEEGVLPVELSESPMVQDLFIRDPTNIFSPMVQARALFHDYVTQLQVGTHEADVRGGTREFFPEESTRSNEQPTDLNSEFEAMALSMTETVNASQTPVVPPQGSPIVIASSPPQQARLRSPPRSPSSIASSQPPPTRPVSPPAQQPGPTTLPTTTSFASPSAPLPPPPLASQTNTNLHNQSGMSFSSPPMMTPQSSTYMTTPFYQEPSYLMQDTREIQEQILLAAQETAESSLVLGAERQVRYDIARACQKLTNVDMVKRFLESDGRLPVCRLTGLQSYCVDGQTPMHLAARYGNIPLLKMFLELGTNISVYVRDLQGRTPLHVAAAECAKAKKDSERVVLQQTIEFLLKAMERERGVVPIGVNAPTDLAGMTPLGFAKVGAEKGSVMASVGKLLFSPGDKSVLAQTPIDRRVGKSPWKAPLTLYNPGSKDNVVYALSQANGWAAAMEDRYAISCPVPNRPAWSLFCVFDGHGGSFSADFLSANFPVILAEIAAELDQELGSSYLPGGTANDSDTTPEVLTDLLLRAAVKAEDLLSLQPRMKVAMRNGSMSAMNQSGSTGLMLLVTSQFVACGNVGDSRAVLALRAMDASNQANLVSSPFAASALTANFTAVEEKDEDTSSSQDVSTREETSIQRRDSASGVRRRSSICPLVPVELSRDHHANIAEERRRVEKAGGEVHMVPSGDGSEIWEITCPRAEVRLRMTRSFGDFFLKQNTDLPPSEQAVIAVPEVRVLTRNPSDAFILLASDGLWDVFSNQEAIDFVAERIGFTAYGGPPGGVSTAAAAQACDELLAAAVERGSIDNLTAILVVPGAPPVLPPIVSTPEVARNHSFYRHNSGILGHSHPNMSFSPNSPLVDRSISMDHPHGTGGSRSGRSPRPSILSPAAMEIDLPGLGVPSPNVVADSLHHRPLPESADGCGTESPPTSIVGMQTPQLDRKAPAPGVTSAARLFGAMGEAEDDELASPLNHAARGRRLEY